MSKGTGVVLSQPCADRTQPVLTETPAPSGPVRVQLRRTKGWRMPENTVRVCRPTIFGNPYTIEEMGRHDAIEAYRAYVTGPLWEDPWVRQEQMRMRARIPALRGKNLACWCAIHKNGVAVPCHADVLLELANAPPMTPPLASDEGPATPPENEVPQ